VPGQPGHAPAVTVERPTGRTSFAIRARSILAAKILDPNTMQRGMPGVRSRRAAWRDVGLGGPPAPDLRGTPTLLMGGRRAYPLSGWTTLTIVCRRPPEGPRWRDRTCLATATLTGTTPPASAASATARPARSLSGHPLTGAKSRARRPASRVAQRPSLATRSALMGVPRRLLMLKACGWSRRRGDHLSARRLDLLVKSVAPAGRKAAVGWWGVAPWSAVH
jgi:hypothetical protein